MAQIRARTLSARGPDGAHPDWLGAQCAVPSAADLPAALCRRLDRMHMWGLVQRRDLARLPRSAVAARLGKSGLGLHELACGESRVPLYPLAAPPEVNEEQSLLDPISDLEPFVRSAACSIAC